MQNGLKYVLKIALFITSSLVSIMSVENVFFKNSSAAKFSFSLYLTSLILSSNFSLHNLELTANRVAKTLLGKLGKLSTCNRRYKTSYSVELSENFMQYKWVYSLTKQNKTKFHENWNFFLILLKYQTKSVPLSSIFHVMDKS